MSVHTCNHEAQLKLLEQCLLRLRKYNLKLNVAKSAFGASSVNYLGYTLPGEGIAPGNEKLLAVKEFTPPVSVKQIRELVGLFNYFGFLIPKFAYYSVILTNLTRAKSRYLGGKLPPLAFSCKVDLVESSRNRPSSERQNRKEKKSCNLRLRCNTSQDSL